MKSTALSILGVLIMSSSFAAGKAFEPKEYHVVMETSMGAIELSLNGAKAPKTVENFLNYVHEKFYDGTIFHRVIPSFMIQGGGMLPGLKEKSTHDPITNEADNGLTNDRGTIAMARTQEPHSATSQFFINVVNNDKLNFTGKNVGGWGYAVFGKVTKGMDIVDKIKEARTTIRVPHRDVPEQDIVIKSIRLK